jgi:hypothetical protein
MTAFSDMSVKMQLWLFNFCHQSLAMLAGSSENKAAIF